MAFDTQPIAQDIEEEAEELTGNLNSQNEEQKLMHSVMEADEDVVDKGKLLADALNQGVSSFTPDLTFEKMVKNYSLTEKLEGESFLRLVSGYDPRYLEKNIGIPEFQKELKRKLEEKNEELKGEGLLTEGNQFSEKAIFLSSLVMYAEELDAITAHGYFGEKKNKQHFIYGSKESTRKFRKGDRYKDIALKNSIKRAIRRGHTTLEPEDLESFEKESKGSTEIIYAIDSSASMKGKKLAACKKAGIALAYKALQEKDKVGVIVFGSDVKQSIAPTADFMRLLLGITKAKADKQTDMAATIDKAVELFSRKNCMKHLMLITDALPTKGDSPIQDALDAAVRAQNAGVTISLVGIELDEKGKNFGEDLTRLGRGQFHLVANVNELDRIVLIAYDDYS